ncbi:MAG: winged helix-turn-helix transcriptional regulator [Nitrospirae bacterium]|nr:winged helix-turn-helix transcriptional regulator [Nitrospirota bacterium]
MKYHINKLKSEEKITLRKIGKFLRLFQNSGAFKDNEQMITAHLKNTTGRLLLRTILENPGITNQELTEKFHMSKSTIHWHIRQFRNDNIVVFEQDGKYKRYFVNAEAEMTLLRFMPENQSIRAQE